MRKKLILIALTTMASLSLFACSRRDIEKQPVIFSDDDKIPASTQTTQDDQTDNQTDSNESEESSLNEPNSDSDKNAKETKTANEKEQEGKQAETSDSKLIANPQPSKDSDKEAAQAAKRAEADKAAEARKAAAAEKMPLLEADSPSPEADGKEVNLIVSIEGNKEAVTGKTFDSSNGYSIIYDKDRFKVSTEKGVDSFAADNSDPELYPYVYLNISRIKNTTSADYAKQLQKSLTNGYKNVIVDKNAILGTYKAIKFTGVTGKEWNSVIRNFYITESENSIYVAEVQYYTEAAEGYGARIKAMLDTFTINK